MIKVVLASLALAMLLYASPAVAVTLAGAAILPGSRAVQVGHTATAFATLLASGPGTATGCTIAPINAPAGTTFQYQQTNAANVPIGQLNTPATIPGGNGQSFVISLSPTAAFAATDVQFAFVCANTGAVAVLPGVNTLLLTSTSSPGPDIVALAATVTGDGIANIPSASGTGFFAVATVNVGAGALITATVDTGSAILPVSLALCQTNPATGACLNPTAASASVQIDAGQTPTFAIFVQGAGAVPFNPGVNRIFVRFKSGGATVGATSVAVRTAAPPSPPVDSTLAKTQLLKGRWHLVYTIGSSTFTDDYSLTTIPGLKNAQGGYYISGTNQYGGPVAAAYWPTNGFWALLDPGSIIDQFYVFYTDGHSILSNSCYYLIIPPGSANLSRCYPLSGTKMSAATSNQAQDASGSRLHADDARTMEHESLDSKGVAVPASPEIIEKYLQMRRN
jgi:hypothetical protein